MSVVRQVVPESLGTEFEADRRRLQRELEATLNRVSSSERALTPVECLAVVYALRAPEHTRHRLRNVLRYADYRRARFGCVYVLRDSRDPEGRVKIGMTCSHGARLAQHRRDLDDRHGLAVMMLCRVESGFPALLERLAHVLLECAHSSHLVNTHTGRVASEYFDVPNVRRLELMLRALARYVEQRLNAARVTA